MPSSSRFQSFADHGGPAETRERIARLREALRASGLAGFVIPRADRHQNEYLPPDQERLLWATGFSGSAGLTVVLQDAAAIFVDGRYTVQAAEQTDGEVFERLGVGDRALQSWLGKQLHAGDALGFDAWLHTFDFIEDLTKTCLKLGATFTPVASNPIDALWTDRPAPPQGAISARPLRLAGEAAEAKLARLRETGFEGDALLVSDPHNVAWLFNIRGSDVSHTPLPLAFAYLPATGTPSLFVEAAKLSPPMRERLGRLADLRAPDELESFLARDAASRKVAFDKASAPHRLIHGFVQAGGKFALAPDPLTLMKAAKNPVEIESTRRAHLRDGVALTRFLAWFDETARRGDLTEIAAAEALEGFRAEDPTFRDVSFPTISAAGPHAALPHYRVGEGSNIAITPGLYLVDSGAQYDEGTTDITRTIAVGRPSAKMIDRYTRVLKGHIAIATAVFPRGTNGAQIDAFARAALWRAGLDFDHGTGHGVGAYLSVHEGPQRIAKTGMVALAPGMILSNEPGYYAPGEFGIRIENLLLVVRKDIEGAEREMLGFETISFAPIDVRPVDKAMLSAEEIAWIDAYHADVRAKLSDRLDVATRGWLEGATAAMA